MSSITLVKLFEPAQLTGSVATYYTVAAPYTVLRDFTIRVTNTTAGAVTVDVHAVPSAGTASDTNAVVKGYSIPANDYRDIDVPVMKVGDFLQAKASAGTSISLHAVSGVLFA